MHWDWSWRSKCDCDLQRDIDCAVFAFWLSVNWVWSWRSKCNCKLRRNCAVFAFWLGMNWDWSQLSQGYWSRARLQPEIVRWESISASLYLAWTVYPLTPGGVKQQNSYTGRRRLPEVSLRHSAMFSGRSWLVAWDPWACHVVGGNVVRLGLAARAGATRRIDRDINAPNVIVNYDVIVRCLRSNLAWTETDLNALNVIASAFFEAVKI